MRIASSKYEEVPPPIAGSVEQIAEHLGVSRTTVFGLLKSGDLPCARLGRRTLIRYSDAAELFARNVSTRNAKRTGDDCFA